MAQNWKNRIIRQETVPISDILPNAKNWRKHPVKQQTHVKGSLDNLGWIRSVLVNLRTSKEWEITERNKKTVIDGHLRLDLALKNGEDKIPVEYVDLSPDEERIALASIDPLAAMAETDEEMLDSLLASIDCDVPEINDMLADVGDLNGLDTEGEAQEDEYEPPAEIQTDIKRGDIILLGRHRLMCGDSTSKEDVGRLMDGKKADMVFTDPPYGVDYQDLKKHHKKIENDGRNDDQIHTLLIRAFAGMPTVGYVCCNWESYSTFKKALLDSGYPIKSCIVWNKKTRAQNLDKYFKQHEFVLYFGPFGGEKTLRGDIWDIQREASDKHPTMKPVALVSLAIQDNPAAALILDPFLGSGTTLIACEQLGRVCYGMEISPQYCEVICQRWEKLTGKKRECLKE